MMNQLHSGRNRKWKVPVGMLLIVLLIFQLTACSDQDKPVSQSFAIEGKSTKVSTDFLEMELNVPVLSGFDSAAIINEKIAENMAAAKAEAEDAASMMEADESQLKAGLHSNYFFSKNGHLVSLWILFDNYTGGAHGLYWIEPYTFNVATSEIYDFPGLFREGNASAALITEKIISDIRENPELYFESAEETVKNYDNQFQYYMNGDQLTVFFSLYDITPYAAGIQYFTFDAEEWKEILKPEIYDAIKDAEPIDPDGTR